MQTVQAQLAKTMLIAYVSGSQLTLNVNLDSAVESQLAQMMPEESQLAQTELTVGEEIMTSDEMWNCIKLYLAS